MGKSTAARMLVNMGVPVNDADQSVHKLMGKGGSAVDEIAKAFPGTLKNQQIDRAKLSSFVFKDPKALKQLEGILHPKVQRLTQKFLRDQQRMGRKMVALDIPLLFETRGEKRVDTIFVVSAPASIQRQRVLARKGMTPEKFAVIRAKQTPDHMKRKRADYVLPTGLGRSVTYRAIKRALAKLQHRADQNPAFPNRSYRRRHPNVFRVF